MNKLTPAKRLKELRRSGWLGFVEFLESKQVRLRDLRFLEGKNTLDEYLRSQAVIFMGEDMLDDLYASNDGRPLKIMGLAAQLGVSNRPPMGLSPKPKKNNKLTMRGIKNRTTRE